MLPMSGGVEPAKDWKPAQQLDSTDHRQRSMWTVRDIAGWLKHNTPAGLTLSESWKLSHELCKGPLADVWTGGVKAGRDRCAEDGHVSADPMIG